jgi:hypothetical protein
MPRLYRGTAEYWWTNTAMCLFLIVCGFVWRIWWMVIVAIPFAGCGAYIAIQQQKRRARASLPRWLERFLR